MQRSILLATTALVVALALSSGTARAQSPAASGGSTSVMRAQVDVSDLPLVELRAAARPAGERTLAIFLTGDGGWASLDRNVSAALARHGVDVVGMDSRAYLGGDRKTPDRAAADVARIARAYMARWGATRLVLVGYSRGADILPFVATRLPADLRARTSMVALLGLAHGANFRFHLMDMIRDTRRDDDLPIAPELARLRPALGAGARLVCVYGADEHDSGCREAGAAAGFTVIARDGGHHFDGDAEAIGEQLWSVLAR